ncbi:MAG: penicillin-binding protein 2 [Verrucomicrobia bacterium]|nr:MAG: penicillin-binding protein 2 [Verrucomicrobiota bacterium]
MDRTNDGLFIWSRKGAHRMKRSLLTSRIRIQFLGLIMLLGMGALGLKLWWIQVAHGTEWTAQLRGSSQATVRIPSVRGEIKDRNGVALVQNRASYEVDFYLPEMVKGYRERFGSPPLTEYRAIINGMPKDQKEPDIIRIVNDGVVPRLNQLDLARDYNSAKLERHFRNDTEVPYSYIKDIDFPTMAKFSEHDVGLPGVDIAIKPVRSYVYGALAAHILGCVGMPDDIDKEEARKFTFYQQDVEGKSNIEKTMDEYLRGKPGVRYLRKNAKGTIEGVLREDPPQQGANVFLTLDTRIQSIAEEALRAVSRAGAVVVDPNNGNILAMASVPSFDPNTFIPSIKAKDWKALQKDEGDPLVDRAISALPPGSTFKLITALAGLRAEGKNLANAHYSCGGGISYGDHFFACWVAAKHYTHGNIGLADAIKVSCDSFFYQYGNAAGIQSIDHIGKMLGIGEESGLRLSAEQSGNMPGPEWMQIHHPQERWSQAQTANVSIGQGYTLVSPLQLAMAYATIANGGVCYYPRLVDKVLKQDGSPALDEQGNPAAPPPRVRSDLRQEISPDKIELVRKGFWKVVNEDGGTGGRARLKDWVVAGKTGTAQATERGHEENVAWMACFAPFDHPKYVVVVMVQGASGHGGEVAGPIATRILERALAEDEGKFDMQVAWLAPAHHANPLQLIKAVSYPGTGGNLGGDDEEGADQSQAATVQMASSDASPDVEPEADSQGQVRRRGAAAVARAVPVAAPQPRNFFERLFGIRRQPTAPAPTPARRRGLR